MLLTGVEADQLDVDDFVHQQETELAFGDLDGVGTVPAVGAYGLLPSMYVSETVDIGGLDALGGTGSTQASFSAENQLSIQDVLSDAGGQNINVEEILDAYAGDNSAAGNAASDTSSSDPGDQTATAYSDLGTTGENYVSMADIMNTVDDGGTSGVNSDIIV